jgi:hypothetical protein
MVLNWRKDQAIETLGLQSSMMWPAYGPILMKFNSLSYYFYSTRGILKNHMPRLHYILALFNIEKFTDEECQNVSLYFAPQSFKLKFGLDNLWVTMEDFTCVVVCLTSNANLWVTMEDFTCAVVCLTSNANLWVRMEDFTCAVDCLTTNANLWVRVEDFTCAVVCLTSNANLWVRIEDFTCAVACLTSNANLWEIGGASCRERVWIRV